MSHNPHTYEGSDQKPGYSRRTRKISINVPTWGTTLKIIIEENIYKYITCESLRSLFFGEQDTSVSLPFNPTIEIMCVSFGIHNRKALPFKGQS